MKLYLTEKIETMKKCGGCNWDTAHFYGIGNSEVETKQAFSADEETGQGVCSGCLAEHLLAEKCEIITHSRYHRILSRFLDIAEKYYPKYFNSDFIAEMLDEIKRLDEGEPTE